MNQEILLYPIPAGDLMFESFMRGDEDDNTTHNVMPNKQDKRHMTQEIDKNKTFNGPNGITRFFLKKFSEKRRNLVNEIPIGFFDKEYSDIEYNRYLAKIQIYFDSLYVFTKIMDTQRKRFHTSDHIPVFKWRMCTGGEVENVCWRFEIIMTAYLYAMWFFNYGVTTRDLKKSHSAIMKAYCILRYVCKEEILTWFMRDELYLPFECTETGLDIFISICMIKLQSHIVRMMTYDRNILDTGGVTIEDLLDFVGSKGMKRNDVSDIIDGKLEIKTRFALWLFYEAKEAHEILTRRLKDGRCPHMKVWAFPLLVYYRIESLCTALHYNAMIAKAKNLFRKHGKIIEYADKIAQQALIEFKIQKKNNTNEMIWIGDTKALIYTLSIQVHRAKELSDKSTKNIASTNRDDKIEEGMTLWDMTPVNSVQFYKNVSWSGSGMNKMMIDSDSIINILSSMLCSNGATLEDHFIVVKK